MTRVRAIHVPNIASPAICAAPSSVACAAIAAAACAGAKLVVCSRRAKFGELGACAVPGSTCHRITSVGAMRTQSAKPTNATASTATPGNTIVTAYLMFSLSSQPLRWLQPYRLGGSIATRTRCQTRPRAFGGGEIRRCGPVSIREGFASMPMPYAGSCRCFSLSCRVIRHCLAMGMVCTKNGSN